MKKLLLLILLEILAHSLFAQSIVLLQQKGERGEKAILEAVPRHDSLSIKFEQICTNTFMNKSLRLNNLVQCYLKNKGQIAEVEPAYLALTSNVGGFACQGCWISNGRTSTYKPNLRYVDIQHSTIDDNLGMLMALPQFFMHEQAHVIEQLLKSPKNSSPLKSVDTHYFNVATNYQQAFTEGWAEHWENIARIYETNPSIRQQIDTDAKILEEKTGNARAALKHDLLLPFRLNAYLVTMPMWYQWYENVKRYNHVNKGLAVFKCELSNAENLDMQIAYRNAGLEYDISRKSNTARLFSTEGFISTLLLRITQSEISKHFLPPTFYQQFQERNNIPSIAPSKLYTPFENQMMKYIVVIAKYLNVKGSNEAPIVLFLNGYMSEYPAERNTILSLYRSLTGLPYNFKTPPEVWFVAKEFQHSILLSDHSGASNIPYYTFNLNAADAIDLQTIKGINKNEATRIISWRDSAGYFYSINDVAKVKDLPKRLIPILEKARYDENQAQKAIKTRINFSKILTELTVMYLTRALGYLLLVWGLILAFFRKTTLQSSGWTLTGYILSTIFTFCLYLTTILLAIMVLNAPWIAMLSLTFICISIAMITYRKSKEKRKRALVFNMILLLMSLYSLL